jgi:hypothetical protein
MTPLTRFPAIATMVAALFAACPAAHAQTQAPPPNLPALFPRLDANGDGQLSKDEFKKLATLGQGKFKDQPAVFDRIFERLDADKDGALSLDEYKKIGDLRGRSSPPSSPAPTSHLDAVGVGGRLKGEFA